MKTILTAILIVSMGLAHAQSNLLAGFTNHGVMVGAGYSTAGGIVLQGIYGSSIIKSTVPSVASLYAGYEYSLSQKDADNFTLTGLVGVASLSYSDAGKYLGCRNAVKPAYTAELAKDWFMGRLYITAIYHKDLSLGAGIKVFFKRY